MADKSTITEAFKELQDSICKALELADGEGKFQEDAWERPGGGGGRTRVIRNGGVIEKGGVNFSAVWGETPEAILKALNLEKADFYATGVSIVMHPNNPMVPIIHMNVRYFEMTSGQYWFGGGIDLTPHYVVDADAKFFHEALKSTCDKFDSNYYTDYKKWADDYFYIKHRKETRGVGGIFFDHLKETSQKSKNDIWQFVLAVGQTFAPTYTHLMSANANKSYNENHLNWQRIRRGRYVEFNLVLDKGTKFGLDTDGRIESILMSLPPMAGWEYDYQPIVGSAEAYTQSMLAKGIDWLK
jgi:coproporphyrinogen III oxidase